MPNSQDRTTYIGGVNADLLTGTPKNVSVAKLREKLIVLATSVAMLSDDKMPLADAIAGILDQPFLISPEVLKQAFAAYLGEHFALDNVQPGDTLQWDSNQSKFVPVASSTFGIQPPANIAFSNLTYFSTDINWDLVAGAVRYEVDIRPSGRTAWTTFPVTATTLAILNLAENSVYEYRLRSFDGVAYSGYTDVAVFNTPGDNGSGKTYAGTIYHVSNSGDDTNDGLSEATAFATPSHAQSIVNAGGGAAAILLERGGFYFMGDIDATSVAGTSQTQRIQWGAYGTGAKPILAGSDNIANRSWTPEGGNLYSLNIALPGAGALFVQGEMVYPCRSNLYTIDTGGDTTLTSTSLIDATHVFTGAQVTYRGTRFSAETQTIETHNQITGEITWTEVNNPNDGEAGNGFYLYNHPAFMASSEDWWYDESAGKLYYLTSGGAPSGEIYAPQYDYGIIFNGPNYAVADIDFRYYYKDAISPRNNYLEIEHCNISDCYNSAIFIHGGPNAVNISYTQIDNISGVGIYGLNADSCEVHHCQITHIAEKQWGRNTGIDGGGESANNQFGCGITWKASVSNYFHHNFIKWIGYCGGRSDGTNHRWLYNYIGWACLNLADGANLYGYEDLAAAHPSTGCIYRYNILEQAGPATGNNLVGYNNQNARKITCTFYLDERCKNAIVEYNTCLRATNHGLKFNYENVGHTIRYNLTYDCENGIHFSNRSNTTTDSHIIEENVFVCLNPTQRCVYLLNQDGGGNPNWNPGTWSNNYYVQPYDTDFGYRQSNGGGTSRAYTFAELAAEIGETNPVNVASGWTYLDQATSENDLPVLTNASYFADTLPLNGAFNDQNGQALPDPVPLAAFRSQFLVTQNPT